MRNFRIVVAAAVAAAMLSGAASASAKLTISPPTLPNGLVGQSYNAQISAGGGQQPYTYQLLHGSLPDGLSLGSDGSVTGMPTANEIRTFVVRAVDSGSPADTGQHTYTIVTGLVLTGPALGSIQLGAPYSHQLSVVGGTGPYAFGLSSGSLPAGITLSSSGLLSGTPEELTSSSFQVQVTDSSNPQQSNTVPMSLSVSVPGQWTLCTYTPSGGFDGIDGVRLSSGGQMSDSDGSQGSWGARRAPLNTITMSFVFRDYRGAWNSSTNEFAGTFSGVSSGSFAMVPGADNGQNCVQP